MELFVKGGFSRAIDWRVHCGFIRGSIYSLSTLSCVCDNPPMNWFPPQNIETSETDDSLIFRREGQPTFGMLWISLVFALTLPIALYEHATPSVLIGILFLAILPLLLYKGRSVSKLTVTANELSATGYLGSSSYETVRLPWSEIKGLEFVHSSEDSPSGLYARQGLWTTRCILPDINERQTVEVIGAIYRRFPYVETAESNPALPSLFGKRHDTVTLGL